MRADSLLYGLRRVDEQGTRLLAMRTLSGPEPLRRVDVAIDALVDLAELLRAAAPFPPRVEARGDDADGPRGGGADGPRTDGGTRASDALVASVLDASYERGSAALDRLDSAVVDGLGGDERFETVDSRVVVPLSTTGPYARNWAPVIEALLARLDGVREDFERVARRVAASGTDGALATGCRAVVEMLGTLARVVRRADADARYVRDRTDHSQRELLSTIETATTQLRSDNDA
ncbi:hypothetical protein [Halorubrum amylolyticum]|uniref:hypothetical protein n=1 Tax=Halorubrum amylolyticum TaxID=2508724 RepID=UPI001009312F|nr:hypothetical protein [Halorubrum amylolyticum]